MYVHRDFMTPSTGPNGDTSIRFIHYHVPGDSVIAGKRYWLLVEEDLAYYNFDQGLVLNRLRFAVRKAGEAWQVKLLRGPVPNAVGRLPLKAAAFDTQYFEDEVTALSPLDSWVFRQAGHPLGYSSASKNYLGLDTIILGHARVVAYRFGLETAGQAHIRYLEWYFEGLKVLATSAYRAREDGYDSVLTEEEWIGKRGFTREDTIAVLLAAGVDVH